MNFWQWVSFWMVGAIASIAGPPAFAAEPEPQAVVLHGADLEALREVTLQAAREGDVKTLQAYIDIGQPLDLRTSRGDTLLILASYNGHFAATRLIASRRGTAIDATNGMGFTALTGAAFKGDLKMARLLVEHGAQVEGATGSERTPLMFAALFGRNEVARFLIEQGADKSRSDSAGQTASSLAAAQGNSAMVTLIQNTQSKATNVRRSQRKPVEAPRP